jgi:hypothetical protein
MARDGNIFDVIHFRIVILPRSIADFWKHIDIQAYRGCGSDCLETNGAFSSLPNTYYFSIETMKKNFRLFSMKKFYKKKLNKTFPIFLKKFICK